MATAKLRWGLQQGSGVITWRYYRGVPPTTLTIAVDSRAIAARPSPPSSNPITVVLNPWRAEGLATAFIECFSYHRDEYLLEGTLADTVVADA
mmetsp:Transcript_31633/g.44054  ORF Transcript_31633/g.44054 Transcript_31633/m.44054 type:complete len:93 (-) Transcript_31633:876-1154(-)